MKILILNQYFPPDRSATAILLGQLASDLAEENDVTVVCGTPTYNPEAETTVFPPRLRRFQVRLFAGGRSNIVFRIANYFFFLLGALCKAVTLPKHDVVICWTDPPLIGLAGAITKHVKGSRFVMVFQDVYPEVALAVGRMNDPFSRFLLRTASSVTLRAADHLVVVGHDMRQALIAKGCLLDRLFVIPNWQDTALLRPTSGSAFRAAHGIPDNAFVIMHSGNIGFSQDFDTLLAAAEKTKDHPGILYVIVGDGGRKKELEEQIQERGLRNVRMFSYQPFDSLAESLSAANLHYVSLLPQLTGYVVPSKVYGILAVARPFLANVLPESEAAYVAQASGSGIVVARNPDEIAKIILELQKDFSRLEAMGKSGRAWIETNGSRSHAVEAYRKILQMSVDPTHT